MTPGAFCVIVATPRAPAGDRRLGGRVAGADVLRERAVDQLVVLLGGIYGHRDHMRSRPRNTGRATGVPGR